MINPEENELEDECQWLQRLAYRMVKDQDQAKDVVQETYLAAMKSPNPADKHTKGWLRKVATNVVRMEHRGRTRRQHREECIAPAEQPETTPVVLQKLHATKVLTASVQALAEPYRSAILLRFVEELSIAEVAAKQEVPVGTAGWRVSEGLKRLRVTLDSETEGDCKPWLMALCPATFPKADISANSASTATTGAPPLIKLSMLFAALCAASALSYAGYSSGDKPVVVATLTSKVSNLKSPLRTNKSLPQMPAAPQGARSSVAATPAIASISDILEVSKRQPSFSVSFSNEDGPQEHWALDILPSLHDTMQVLTSCYSDMLNRQPDLTGTAGRVHVDIALESHDDQISIATDTQYLTHINTEVDGEFRECMRESSFALEFEPPSDHLRKGLARITMDFPDHSDFGNAKQAMMQECLEDLQQRRPAMFSEGDFNDPTFATCMSKLDQETDIRAELASQDMPEAFQACLELEQPGAFEDCIEAAGGTVRSSKERITAHAPSLLDQ